MVAAGINNRVAHLVTGGYVMTRNHSTENREQLLGIFEELSKAIGTGHNRVPVVHPEMIPKKFEELRDVLGYKVSDISKKLDISDQTYHRWLRGKAKPRLKNLKKLEDFLREGDIDPLAERVTPFILGVHTWRHMAAMSRDLHMERMWIFSAEGFLEGDSVVVSDTMMEALKSRSFEACYVFPTESAGAFTWERWTRRLRAQSRDEVRGTVLGFPIMDIKEVPMFLYGTYSVLYEYSDGHCEGFLAFRARSEVIELLGVTERTSRQSELVWTQVHPDMAWGWFNTYCILLSNVARQYKESAPTEVVHRVSFL